MARTMSERDLIDYIAGQCADDDIRRRIKHQLQVPGSPVVKRIEQIDAKLADPLNIDWAAVALGSNHRLEEVNRLCQQAEEMYERAGFHRAIELACRARELCKRRFGKDLPEYGTCLNLLGRTRFRISEYDQAETLLKEAVEVDRKVVGEHHPNFARDLTDLAEHLCVNEEYAEAERLAQQAIDILTTAAPADDLALARAISVLGSIRYDQGRHSEAEKLFRKALETVREAGSEEHHQFATELRNVADLHCDRGEYDIAEPMYKRAAEIHERAFGRRHPEYGGDLFALAELYREIGDNETAEMMYREAIDIDLTTFGENHADYAIGLNSLAELYRDEENYVEAERLCKKAMKIDAANFGKDHRDYAIGLNNLATLCREQGNYRDAEKLYIESLEIDRKELGEHHPNYATGISNLGELYHEMGEYEKAEQLFDQAVAIRKESLGEDHPEYADALFNLAVLCASTNLDAKAFRLMQQAAKIDNQVVMHGLALPSITRREKFLTSVEERFHIAVSLVLEKMTGVPDAIQWALEFVVHRKALVDEPLAAQRDKTFAVKYPREGKLLQTLTNLRRELMFELMLLRSDIRPHTGTVEDPAEYRDNLDQMRRDYLRLETELAARIPELARERSCWTASREELASALSQTEALAEYARINVYDFGAIPARGDRKWKDTCYLAFVLPSGSPGDAAMVDLGDASRIDQVVAEVQQEPVLVREAVLDPIVPVLQNKRELVVARDGRIRSIDFQELVVASKGQQVEQFRFRYIETGRDVIRLSA